MNTGSTPALPYVVIALLIALIASVDVIIGHSSLFQWVTGVSIP